MRSSNVKPASPCFLFILFFIMLASWPFLLFFFSSFLLFFFSSFLHSNLFLLSMRSIDFSLYLFLLSEARNEQCKWKNSLSCVVTYMGCFAYAW
jgi:hypothetical protein